MPNIDTKLKFLLRPESYGEPHRPVECLETHMSWVFMVGERVFKLKKPICLPLLDFTSVEARAHFCREEVRLNGRLAPGIYLDVIALQWCDGVFSLVNQAQLPAPGETVDWLVLMRRLPSQQMLPQMMADHKIRPHHIAGLVTVLGNFYRSAPAVPVSAIDYVNRFKDSQAANRELLLQPDFELPQAARAIDRLDIGMTPCAELMGERACEQRIVDGHGDLRPDHVCLLAPPVVIDCLEFNPHLRQVDPFDELSFLRMECDLADAPWFGAQLVAGVADALRDHPPAALLHFYAAHRALLRARLALSHLLDARPRTPQKWLPLARRYVERALLEIDSLNATRMRGRIE